MADVVVNERERESKEKQMLVKQSVDRSIARVYSKSLELPTLTALF